jgi:hypothetical protein
MCRRSVATSPGRLAHHLDLALARALVAVEQAQQRGLAGAARAREHDEVALVDAEREVGERRDLDGADREDLRHPVQLDHRHARDTVMVRPTDYSEACRDSPTFGTSAVASHGMSRPSFPPRAVTARRSSGAGTSSARSTPWAPPPRPTSRAP